MPAAWIAAAGTAVAAAGAIAGGIASSNSASYQAQVAQNNAAIENQNSTNAQQSGYINAFNTSLANRGAAGKLKANQAANGINVNSGTAVDVQASEREVGLQNVSIGIQNAQRQAYGYRTQSVGDQAQAGLDTMQSQNDLIGGALGAAGAASNKQGQQTASFLGNLFSSGGGDPNAGQGSGVPGYTGVG
jgi:hypothetical protein